MVLQLVPMLAVDIGQVFKIGNKSIEEAPGYANTGDFITQIVLPNVLVVANIILFLMIVASGLVIIFNAGNPDKQRQGSQTLTASVIGFIIIFAAYWIMQILGIFTGFNLLGGVTG
ncbi:MAG: hypothetical protein ACOX6V_03790 [Patescibacteria group bacterium]|jgi:hypothetical protein